MSDEEAPIGVVIAAVIIVGLGLIQLVDIIVWCLNHVRFI
jgi:hypothetical protein